MMNRPALAPFADAYWSFSPDLTVACIHNWKLCTLFQKTPQLVIFLIWIFPIHQVTHWQRADFLILVKYTVSRYLNLLEKSANISTYIFHSCVIPRAARKTSSCVKRRPSFSAALSASSMARSSGSVNLE